MSLVPHLPLISVVIPNYNGSRYLERCLKSLLSQTYTEMEIVVVDNASQDQSIDIVRTSAPQAILLKQNKNLGFAGGVNAGIRASHGKWVAVLNNDTEVTANWLHECALAIQAHPEADFFACRIMDSHDSGRLYSAGDCFLRAGIGYRRGQEQQDREEFHRECAIFSASGCAALYRKSVLEITRGFDERFFAYLEDVDLGLRLQVAGCRGYYLPRAEVHHHGAGTSGGEFSPLSVRLRTRNALLLLLKSMPGSILLRCLPMIFLMQLSWLLRVVFRGRVASYLKGLCGACILAPAMLTDRAGMRQSWKKSKPKLWQGILNSESLARNDFTQNSAPSVSFFLKWYFRLF
jgi:GT2 family glycosyltransferase